MNNVVTDQLNAIAILGIVMAATAVVTLIVTLFGPMAVKGTKKGFKLFINNTNKISATIVIVVTVVALFSLTLPEMIGFVIGLAFLVGLIASSPNWAKAIWAIAAVIGLINKLYHAVL